MSQAFWNDFLQFIALNKNKYSIVLNILEQAHPSDVTENTLILRCSKGAKVYLDTRHRILEEAFTEFFQRKYTIRIIGEEEKKKKVQEGAPLLDYRPSTEDLLSGAGLNVKYNFDNFAVSSNNQVAYAASRAVAESPGTAYNPLFIYGGVGVGKTHLAQSAARFILEKNPDKKIYYCPSDRFTNELIESMREKSTAKFRRKYRPLGVLIIDDIQFIAGKERVQEEFFHTFNDIISSGGQIILTSDRPPQQIKDLEDRLRSRFSGGLIVDIQPPDFELRTAILLIKAQEKNIEIDMQSAQEIAQHVEDTRALEGTLVSIYAQIIGKKERIDTEAVENFFNNKKTDKTAKKLSANDIIRVVCTYFNIKQSHIKGPSRVEHLAFARQVAMYLLHKQLGMKLVEIAFLLKRKDHTTVIHGNRKIEEAMMKDSSVKEQVDAIIKSLHSST